MYPYSLSSKSVTTESEFPKFKKQKQDKSLNQRQLETTVITECVM